MRLLLDTHIWHWSAYEPERLHQRVAATLLDKGNDLYVSPISTWELLTLAARGRVDLGPEPARWIAQSLREGPFRAAPLTHEIALRARELQMPHDDPGDRLIAATALALDLVLITSDKKLLAVPGLQLLSNR